MPDYAALSVGILWAPALRARTCGDFVGMEQASHGGSPGPPERGPGVPDPVSTAGRAERQSAQEAVAPKGERQGARLDADPRELRPLPGYPAGSGEAATRAVTNCDRRAPVFAAPMAPSAYPERLRAEAAAEVRTRRSAGHRFVAWAREYSNHAHLRARRPHPQGASDRTDRAPRGETRQIPAPRRSSRVPRNPLIMQSISPP